MNQLDLWSAPLRFPRARRTDPISSLHAADLLERTGAHRAQAEAILAAVRRFPNSTSHEIARAAGIDRYAVARRCPELAQVGLIERVMPTDASIPCSVSGKRVVRWRPA